MNITCSNIIKYGKHILQLGGFKDGRRFQSDSSFIFNSFMYLMNKNINGLTFIVDKNNIENKLKVEDVNKIIDFIKENIYSDKKNDHLTNYDNNQINLNDNNDNNNDNNNNDNNNDMLNIINKEKIDNETIKKKRKYYYDLINRLKPYSNNLPGSSLYLESEKKSFYSIIESEIILTNQVFRWFLTISISNVFDNKLYEIVIGDNFLMTENEKKEYVIIYKIYGFSKIISSYYFVLYILEINYLYFFY